MAARDETLEADDALAEGERDDLHLDLPLPDTLPSHGVLEPGERDRVRDLLTQILAALQLRDRRKAAAVLKRLLADVADVESTPVAVVETGTPANPDHVDDFDTYFRVNRIASPQTGLSLVRGLLQTSSAVMDLFTRSNELKPERVEQQVEGFCTYARLLARTFDLEEIS